MSLVCKKCGYKQSDAQTVDSLKKQFPNMPEHDIPYYCGACIDEASNAEYVMMWNETHPKMKIYVPKNYNYDLIRKNNVNSCVQSWYDFIIYSGIDTGSVDPMLYAIELQYRTHNRYGHAKLPSLSGNIFSGREYYDAILPPYFDSNPYHEEWSAENQKKDALIMLEYLLTKSIKPETVLKWKKNQ